MSAFSTRCSDGRHWSAQSLDYGGGVQVWVDRVLIEITKPDGVLTVTTREIPAGRPYEMNMGDAYRAVAQMDDDTLRWMGRLEG